MKLFFGQWNNIVRGANPAKCDRVIINEQHLVLHVPGIWIDSALLHEKWVDKINGGLISAILRELWVYSLNTLFIQES